MPAATQRQRLDNKDVHRIAATPLLDHEASLEYCSGTHIDEKILEPLLVDADWQFFCQAMYKGIEGNEWRELYNHYREMSKAAGAKKPSESRKAKALWAIKAAKDWE